MVEVVLPVVFLARDTRALHALRLMQARTFAPGDHAVGLRAVFDPLDALLARFEPVRLACGERAAAFALFDAAFLVELSLIDTGRAGLSERGTRRGGEPAGDREFPEHDEFHGLR
ncbi:MAG: hypothetical protein KJZ98_15430 [Burkholderiaceae bacterium]|nr:hypothetical protein [Burkholderiaceae bacterium]MEB2352305.1 hypothetical protein [Burkholderiaceae bacterium]